MNVIQYSRRMGTLECESVKTDKSSQETELRFEEKITGSVRLSKTCKKIDGKSCIFNTGELPDGIYRPIIYLSSSVIEPEAFEISRGIPKLIPKDDEYVRRLSRELEVLRREISKIKSKLSEYDEKINGNPIF
ncbi:MAG: hypothetical protein IJW38_04200 [Clostridia bacterium]|nr:hypothetical protein [Clostridia bacterium]